MSVKAQGTEVPASEAIARSLDRLRQSAGIVRYEYICTERIIEGSLSAIEPERYAGNTIPSEDIAIESRMEVVQDFVNNRSWSKGSQVDFEVIESDYDAPRVNAYLVFSHSAFNGSVSTSLTPRETLDPKQRLPPRISFPVEYWRHELDGTQDPEMSIAAYPMYLVHGALPSLDDPIRARKFLPAFDPSKWRIASLGQQDGTKVIVLTSLPNSQGSYDEYTLNPATKYIPSKWVRYSRGYPWHVVDINANVNSAGDIALNGWSVKQYSSKEVLTREETYRVVEQSRVTDIADDEFEVLPTDGMITFNLNDADFRIAGVESAHFETNYEANEYKNSMRTRSAYWYWILLSTAVTAAILFVGFVVRRFRAQSYLFRD